MHTTEELDSAVETDYEDDGRSRSFSRQESGIDDQKGKLTPKAARKTSSFLRERTSSLTSTKRKESILSHEDPDAVGSDLSVASKSARVKVFVSECHLLLTISCCICHIVFKKLQLEGRYGVAESI